jgi:hypothetical protein
LRALYAYLLENRFIIPMAGCKMDFLGLSSLQVLGKLQKGDQEWEKMVPPQVVEIIKSRKFFGWKP